jgi:hypothetical protein
MAAERFKRVQAAYDTILEGWAGDPATDLSIPIYDAEEVPSSAPRPTRPPRPEDACSADYWTRYYYYLDYYTQKYNVPPLPPEPKPYMPVLWSLIILAIMLLVIL